MPYAMRKNSDGTYRVINESTGEVHMKSGTKSDAEAQMRLLHGVDAGWTPKGRRKAKRNKRP